MEEPPVDYSEDFFPWKTETPTPTQTVFNIPALAPPLHRSAEVILSRLRAIPTETTAGAALILNDLRMACRLQQRTADEVARNGVLQRITSARGFLW